MNQKQINTNKEIESKIYDAFFESQEKIIDFVEDNYIRWNIPNESKMQLDNLFWDTHKKSCALMTLDDIQANEVKA